MSKEQLQDMANFTRKASAQQAEEEVQAPFGTENAEDSQQQNEIAQPELSVESEEVEAPTMPMTDEGDPDFAKVEPTKAYEYLQNEAGLSKEEQKGFVDANLSEATKALEKAKKNPPTIGTSLQKYNQAKQEYSARVEEAQAKVDYWNAVKGELDKADAVELRKRAEAQAEETRKAKEAEEQRQQEELQKQAEQKERGANNVAQSIKEKWDTESVLVAIMFLPRVVLRVHRITLQLNLLKQRDSLQTKTDKALTIEITSVTKTHKMLLVTQRVITIVERCRHQSL